MITRLPPTRLELAALLRTIVMPLAREIRRYATDPLTPTQLSVIGYIDQHGPLPLGDLAAAERLSAPTISKVVTAIEEHGFVERLADGLDRRVCLVRTTASGQRWIDEGRSRRNEWLASCLADLSPSDQAAVAAAIPALERLLENAGPDGT